MAVLIANDRPPRSAEEPRRYAGRGERIPLFPTAERPALQKEPNVAPQPESARSGEDAPS
ncbi:transmembrane protein [Mycolicibacterium conceptionense]|nr:transmembrane protein [Mycolicibacterium conceptionense]